MLTVRVDCKDPGDAIPTRGFEAETSQGLLNFKDTRQTSPSNTKERYHENVYKWEDTNLGRMRDSGVSRTKREPESRRPELAICFDQACQHSTEYTIVLL